MCYRCKKALAEYHIKVKPLQKQYDSQEQALHKSKEKPTHTKASLFAEFMAKREPFWVAYMAVVTANHSNK